MLYCTRFWMVVVAFLVTCSPAIVRGQIGQHKSNVAGFQNKVRILKPTGQAADESLQVKDDPGKGVTTTFLVHRDYVRGLSRKWDGELTLDEALASLNSVSGLPELKPAPKKDVWIIDDQQSTAYPPLGAWETRAVNVPVAKIQTGAVWKWTEYYNKWGMYLGKSPVSVEPIMTTYSKYLGSYPFSATKIVIPLVRTDGSARVWVEVSNNTANRNYMTNFAQLAEPEFYWRSRFARLRYHAKYLDTVARPNQPMEASLKNLRPYHLKVGDDYERAVLNHVAPGEAEAILARWKTNTFLCAVDDLHVPMSAIREFREDCDPKQAVSTLLSEIKTQSSEIIVRRAEVVDDLGSLEWVPLLAVVLKNSGKRGTEKHDQTLKVMQLLALRHTTSAVVEQMGDDETKWTRWYRAQRKENAMK